MSRRPNPLLLLTAHPDDAALSCAALLEQETPVDVVTVFAGEPETSEPGAWDSLCGFASAAEGVQARRGEEEAAFAGSPHRLRFLDLPDSQYVTDRPSAHASAIAAAARDWSSEHPGGTVAIPAGAGYQPSRVDRLAERLHLGRLRGPIWLTPHEDHVYLRDAVVAAPPAAPILVYEEFPYWYGRPAEPDVELLAGLLGATAEPLVLPVDRTTKAARLVHYRSQLPHIIAPSLGPVDDPASLPEVERFWVLSGA